MLGAEGSEVKTKPARLEFVLLLSLVFGIEKKRRIPMLHRMRKISPLLAILLLSSFPFTGIAEEAYQVTGKAWGALGRKDWNAAISHADRALRTWGAQAKPDECQVERVCPR